MLPKIARLPSGTNRGGRWGLILWGITLFSLPTFFATAQSEDVKSEPKAAAAAAQPGQPGAASVAGSKSPALEFFPELSHQEQQILRELEALTTVHFTDESLDGIRDTLMERHKINILIDKVKLQEESVPSDATDISLAVAEVPLRSALRLMLRPKGLTYVIEDDVLKITTLTVSEQFRITRTYPVQDLTGSGPNDFQSLMEAVKQGVTPGYWRESHEPMYGSPSSEPSRMMPTGLGLIARSPSLGGPLLGIRGGIGGAASTRTPVPDRGDASNTISMVPASGSLVVRQSLHGHDEVLTLLRALRRAKALSVKK